MPDLKNLGNMAITGLVSQFAPGIAAGFLVELLKEHKVDVQVISLWIQENRSLWGEMGFEDQENMRALAAKVHDVSWMTADWAIEAVRRDLPAIASLFLGWPKARHWLDRQVAIIQRELKKES